MTGARKAAEAAAEIFRAKRWTWGLPTGDGIPTVDEIEATYRMLAKQRGYRAGTGRLWVEHDRDLATTRYQIQLAEEWLDERGNLVVE